jgi:MFS superfamily sulfate permease-like transporter
MRVVIQQLAIFLLPILLYAVYLFWRRWRARVAGQPEPPWEHSNWYWAVVVGLVLTIASFIILDALTVHSPNVPFRPPSWKP